MAKIKIHRGTHQIGGSIVEIYTDKTHIFIDFGSELNVSSEESTDLEMVNMIKNARCDAILFTHYHGDHVGLLKHIPEKDIDGNTIKIVMGELAGKVLMNIYNTLASNSAGTEKEKDNSKKYLKILKDKNRKIALSDGQWIRVGDIEVLPVMVDHSAYEAFLFIIKADGKTIVHTGDFRSHGRNGKNFFDKLEKQLGGLDIDVLITEGTMMSRFSEEVLTEEKMEEIAFKELSKSENKYAFLICSSTNLESLASFANAAMRLKRALYVNHYVYEQIVLFRDTAGKENSKFEFRKAYKFENMEKYNPKLGMTQPEYMREKGFVMLIGKSDSYKKRMDKFKDLNPLLIYSMWGGYVKEGTDTYDEALGRLYYGFDENRRLDLHTSGHATPKDIEKMILTVNPKKAIVPIHTEKVEMFEKLDIGEYGEKLKMLKDNESMEV